MAVVISQANSYNAGAELWATPQLEASRSSQRLDWYLNFQIAKAKMHQRLETSPQVKKIVQACELELPENPIDGNQGLLISTTHLLPARWVLVQPLVADFKNWVSGIHQSWESLKHPQLRIFLPTHKTAADFQSQWSSLSDSTDYGIVLDA